MWVATKQNGNRITQLYLKIQTTDQSQTVFHKWICCVYYCWPEKQTQRSHQRKRNPNKDEEQAHSFCSPRKSGEVSVLMPSGTAEQCPLCLEGPGKIGSRKQFQERNFRENRILLQSAAKPFRHLSVTGEIRVRGLGKINGLLISLKPVLPFPV